VTFSYVVGFHSYVAHVDAYMQNIEELTPFAVGSPLLMDAMSGKRVEPRWTADCSGYPSSPATAGATGRAGNGDDIGGAPGETGGKGGNPGVTVYDTLTQTPHACSSLH
jgi:hypothetical protein